MTGRFQSALFIGSFAALIVIAGCRNTGRPAVSDRAAPPTSTATISTAPASPTVDPEDARLILAPVGGPDYVGDESCASCHAGMARLHRASRHATSVHRVTPQSDGALFRSSQEVHDAAMKVTYRQAIHNGDCVTLIGEQNGTEIITARYAMGSGRYGFTYVGPDSGGRWYETRMTYYSQLRRWDYTPGLEPPTDPRQSAKGMPLTELHLKYCFSCHVTTLRLAQNGMPTPDSHLNVGCERCHGPGRRHVEAVKMQQSGSSNRSLEMEDLQRATRERNIALCGVCHSAPDEMPRSPEMAYVLSRFAATALQQSRCYLQSGTLSCATCHDVHALTAKPRGGYEVACLNCHNTSSAQAGGANMRASIPTENTARVCRINPRNGCIRCHMSEQKDRSVSRVAFHNHWIKIY